MGTRSNIIRENLDGSYDSIYCHWDGYPSHNGRILLEHYQDPKKLNRLLSLGNLSSLGEVIGRKHSFDRQYKANRKDCTFYGRDRGELDQGLDHYNTFEEFKTMLTEAWTEWVYIYKIAENKWYFMNNPSPTWFKCCGTEQLSLIELKPEAFTE